MKFFVFFLWLILGVFYWMMSRNCCDEAGLFGDASLTLIESEKITGEDGDNGLGEDDFPIVFAFNEDRPRQTAAWPVFKDSLLESLEEDQIISIEGKYFANENSAGERNLGEARASAVKSLIGEIADDRIVVSGKELNEEYSTQAADELLEIQLLKQNNTVKETKDRAIINFQFNSTEKLSDEDLEGYLVNVANRVKASGERIRLTGHTDNPGSSEINEKLGIERAVAIKSFLVDQGVSPDNIIVRSMGEEEPIASNDTEEGRAKNRRVELEVIK